MCATLAVKGQILSLDKNFENTRYKEDKNFYADLSVSYSLVDNENILSALKLGSDLTFIKGKSAVASISDYYRTTINDAVYLNSGYTQLIYRYGFRSKITPEFIIQYQWDDALGMTDRFLAGFNSRFKMVKEDRTSFILAGGFMYESEKWNLAGSDSLILSNHLKLNIYLSFSQKIGESTTFSFNSYVQGIPNAEIIHPRISPAIQLSFRINEKLSFATNYSFQYDPAPVIAIKNFHYVFTNGLTLKL